MKDITPIPIGVEFYKDMISKGYYYVDKTLLIRDMLAQKNTVTLFTRPRRFGKTLAQSMLKTFFEKEILPDGTVADNSIYFQGKKIMEAGEEYLGHMGQYPVIFLSLKSAKQPTYEMAYLSIMDETRKEYGRHKYVLEDSSITEKDKERFNAVLNMEADMVTSARAIAFLSECLEKYHKQKVIILLDEYDVPLENAYFNGFYDQMVSFIRSLFESALKTNESLGFGVVTGCLRISRESIFTGLNNLDVVSVLNEDYAEYFGFTQDETDAFLETYGIAYKGDEVKKWYDGYLFGHTEVYNPWSVINYVKDIVRGNTEFPKPYWSNTSSNSIVRELIENADDSTRQELEELAEKGTIEKPVYEDITYADIYKSQDNLWNFLFFTGYLKAVKRSFREQQIYLSMTIPNEEILYIYKNNIQEWSLQCIGKQDLSGLVKAFEEGDCETASDIITGQLMETISFYDYKEDYYHGFIAGLLKNNGRFFIKSNRESGLGRYDLTLRTKRIRKGRAIILEFKVAGSIHGLEKGCMEALEQIESLHYDSDIIEEGYTDILKYGLCFYKKECLVMKKE
ncbi:MAG: AAA family ATPase [Lachnospiraceae bacterium]|nr:AAA family ATPase [Lachnospiraceae bacterium]